MRAHDKQRVLAELSTRVVSDVARRGAAHLEDVLAQSAYLETQRLKVDAEAHKGERQFWRDISTSLRSAAPHEQHALFAGVVAHYGQEICGQFDERVYQSVTRAGEPLLGLLLNAVSPKNIFGPLLAGQGLPRFSDNIILQGETDALKELRQRGTVILVPTHVSHMDSIAVGYALWKLNLPPFLYGAGLNLFSNPMLGFFMRNLGAYTVDRRKTDAVYKTVLKEYCTLTLENGYDNIFFPGGTRSRSGALEKKLKLGLVGCGISAYINNIKNKKNKAAVFIVPATLSFSLVLEAETLIDDFLKEQGRSRYIITDDEFSRPRRVFEFLTQLLSLDAKVHFTVGHAIDPFGNDVDRDGNSIDAHGRLIDTRRYIARAGEIVVDDQRDAEFTREVSERIVEAYAKDSVIASTHVTAHALLSLLRSANAGTDLVRLLRGSGRVDDVPLLELYVEVKRLLQQLRVLAARGDLRLSALMLTAHEEDVVAEGLRFFASYHTHAAAQRRGDRVLSMSRPLLFYYSNRLEGFAVQTSAGTRPTLTADHRALAAGA